MIDNIVLTNKITSAMLELDTVTTTSYILDGENTTWGQIEANHHSFKYVNQVGLEVTNTTLETRDVVVQGWVIAKTENQMEQRKQMLNRFVNPQQMLELKYKDYTLDFLPSRTIQYSLTYQENNDVVCKFKISGMSPDPLFKSQSENKNAAATTVGLFHFPLIIGLPGTKQSNDNGYPTIMFGLRKPSLIVDIYNKGAVATGIRIVFKATATIKNPSLINVDTQQYFKINKTMVAGEEVVIDTNVGKKKIRGYLNGVEYNYFKYIDFGSKWLQLEVGDNLFRYDAEENMNGLEVYIYYYDRFLEVQGCN